MEHTRSAIHLVFVNNSHRICSYGVQEFAASNHSIVFAVKKAAKIREIRSFKRYNKEQFCKDVADIPWSTVESFDDINDAASAWNSLFVDVANRHTPIKRLRTKGALKPWLTNDLKELMAERVCAFKVAKRSGGQQQWDNYRKLKNFTNRKKKAVEAEYYKNLIKSAVGPREMWHSLNSVLGAKKEEGSAF